MSSIPTLVTHAITVQLSCLSSCHGSDWMTQSCSILTQSLQLSRRYNYVIIDETSVDQVENSKRQSWTNRGGGRMTVVPIPGRLSKLSVARSI